MKSFKVLSRVSFDNAVASMIGISSILVMGEAYFRTALRDAQTAKECRYPPVSNILSASHVRELEENHMVVIHNVLTLSQLEGARKCATALGNSMDRSNHVNDSDVRQDQVCVVKESDTFSDVDVNPDEHGDDMIHCIKMLRGIPHILNRFNYNASSSYVVPRQCQLARYLPDGSVYVRHLDKCTSTLEEMGLLGWLRASDYRYRAVTIILYLNAPDWNSGGNLRCYGQGGGAGGGVAGENDDDDSRSLDINPTGGTMILFDSSKVEHQVLPSSMDRYALTLWINGVETATATATATAAK